MGQLQLSVEEKWPRGDYLIEEAMHNHSSAADDYTNRYHRVLAPRLV